MLTSFRAPGAALLWIACLAGGAQAEEATIGVLSAFAPEASLLEAAMEERSQTQINGVTFTTGSLKGRQVVLALSGISMVNAAMTTQLLLDHFEIDALVVSGIAGGVDPALGIGDVVVPAQWGQYLEALFAREAGDGWSLPPGGRQHFANYGMIFPQPVTVRRQGEPSGTERFWFDADPAMLATATGLAGSTALTRCAKSGDCLVRQPKVNVGGHGVSGQAFVDNAAFRSYVFATFNARVLDMETAAIAMVAHANDVPFIAFRSLSDLAGGGPGENEIGTFFQLAADNAALVVMAFLETWRPESKDDR